MKVVEAGNMTAAAQRLGLAQPALGAQIKQLEDELGVKLLVRHSRGVEATEAGKLLAERARSILSEVDRTRTELRTLGARHADHLVLGVNPSIVLMLGADLLHRAREEMPDVALSLVEERTPFCWRLSIAGRSTSRSSTTSPTGPASNAPPSSRRICSSSRRQRKPLSPKR